MKGRPRADIKGLWRAGINFLRKGLYRADMKGLPRDDGRASWRARV